MRKIILSMSVSVDGFIEGPDRQIDWHMVDDELHSHFNEQLRAMGTFLNGRVSHELMAGFWPTGDLGVQALQVHRPVGEAERPPRDVVTNQQLDAGLDAISGAGGGRQVVPCGGGVLGQPFTGVVDVRGSAGDPGAAGTPTPASSRHACERDRARRRPTARGRGPAARTPGGCSTPRLLSATSGADLFRQHVQRAARRALCDHHPVIRRAPHWYGMAHSHRLRGAPRAGVVSWVGIELGGTG